ncbi:MAG: hypothetical protein RSA12_11315, partial [Clostridia bacterium]
MKRLVAAALSLALLTGVTAPHALAGAPNFEIVKISVTSFTDVDRGFWGYNDIFTIVNKGA